MKRSPKTIPSAGRLARICVTGGIACGKNLAGATLAKLGVPVIDADQVCHAMMQSGGPFFKRLVAAFGEGIVGSDGEIDRGFLGRRVFADEKELKRLNRLAHPGVMRTIEAWIVEQAGGGAGRLGIIVALVPLVYEAEWERAWDWIICVGAPMSVQVERLKLRGLTPAEARARIAAQWPVEEKMRRADYVVFNGGTPDCARRQTVRIFDDIVQHMEKKHGRNPSTR